MDEAVTYRGYRIHYDPPPIPDRRFDWHFAHENFDGAPDAGDHRHGDAASLEEAKAEIDDMIEDEADAYPPGAPEHIRTEYRTAFRHVGSEAENFEEPFYRATWADGRTHDYDTWSAIPAQWHGLYQGPHDLYRLQQAVTDAIGAVDRTLEAMEPVA
jgi:hypothetical protein